ncbi:hypothetical protein INR49_008296 [Caranx melampygus]|nr:hypothetical protein INR49_008297 [Caranx melampygus]KAG7232621.1 hypothetical protein INR49_008296 [Caranx melampygus]
MLVLVSLAQGFLPIDCDEVYRYDNTSSSGVYTIYPGGPTTPLHVFCDMDTDGGRWTVSLDNIFLLTMRKKNELRVDMEDFEGGEAFAQYSSFMIDSEIGGYQLDLGGFTGGTAGDSLSNHNSMKFTTYDKDQDQWENSCGQRYLGGFWYNACHTANPNGLYAPNSVGYENTQIVTALMGLLVSVASVQEDPHFSLPIDCDDLYRRDNTSTSGVYTIYPGGPTTPLHVFCDMETDGGRWTVFQRRMDGSENFYRPWEQYKSGFGHVAGEHWLGLDNIFLLTMRKKNELRVDMEDFEGVEAFAQYSSFIIDSEIGGYQLDLGGFTGGTAGDSLSNHNSMKFTTYDKDQDQWDKNCAQHYVGGFWYKACHYANPNGLYAPNSVGYENTQIVWQSWKGWNICLKTITMKMRSVAKCSCTY